jgi:hypothetical protein
VTVASQPGPSAHSSGPLTRRTQLLGLDGKITAHSQRDSALTAARERRSNLIDLQDFAGYGEPSITRDKPIPEPR